MKIKRNFIDRASDQIKEFFGEMGSFDAIKSQFTRPIYSIVNAMLPKLLFGREGAKSLKDKDDLLPGIFNDYRKSLKDISDSNPVLKFAYEMIFGKRKEAERFDAQRLMKIDPKETTNFDELTKKSITDVIPYHLSEIKEINKKLLFYTMSNSQDHLNNRDPNYHAIMNKRFDREMKNVKDNAEILSIDGGYKSTKETIKDFSKNKNQ